MGTYLKPATLNLSRLNNKEYLNMMQRIITLLAEEEAVAKLGVEELLTALKADAALLEDLVNRTTASVETQEMSKADAERDSLVNYLTTSVRNAANSPVATHREAYTRLEIALRPYKGLARMRNMEETAAVSGLLLDLGKEANATDIATLGLTDVVTALKEANDRYASLTDARAAGRSATQMDDSKTVRSRTDVAYDDLTTRIMAVNIVTPCTEAESFLKLHNQIVAETQNALAQRQGAAKATRSAKSE